MEGYRPSGVIIDEALPHSDQIISNDLRLEALDILSRNPGAVGMPMDWAKFDKQEEAKQKVGAWRSSIERAKKRNAGKRARAARRNNR